MKRLFALLLVFVMMLSACSGGNEETTEQTTAEETTAAQLPAFVNPLNGTVLSEAFTGRIFSVAINNVSSALPHRGVSDADVFFEMFINDYCTRGLALYTDIKKVPDVGSIRSTRYNFTDITQCYDTVMIYSGGSKSVLKDMNEAGIDNIAIDENIGYRDSGRKEAGYAFEHTLFASGEALYNAAVKKGYDMNLTRQDYGMKFSDEGTPVNGSAANEIEIVFTLDGRTKSTVMKYDSARDEYIYNQYGKEMVDENTGETESFRNVFVLFTPMISDPVYHISDIFGTGTGYFACGGKLVQVKWSVESPDQGFTFTLEDGTPILQERGTTYIALAPQGSPVNVK